MSKSSKSLHHAVGKTVACIDVERVHLTTYDARRTPSITAIVFTDGSRIAFGAMEVEHGDPVPTATYYPER